MLCRLFTTMESVSKKRPRVTGIMIRNCQNAAQFISTATLSETSQEILEAFDKAGIDIDEISPTVGGS